MRALATSVKKIIEKADFECAALFSLRGQNLIFKIKYTEKLVESETMLFVVTAKWKPENMEAFTKVAMKEMVKPLPIGTKNIGTYYLLGRCQMVLITDAPDEKTIFKLHQPYMAIAECDWAPAMTPEEVLKALAK